MGMGVDKQRTVGVITSGKLHGMEIQWEMTVGSIGHHRS